MLREPGGLPYKNRGIAHEQSNLVQALEMDLRAGFGGYRTNPLLSCPLTAGSSLASFCGNPP